MKIHAFEGYRYTPAAGDADVLAAPPFDQIDEELAAQLHGASAYQFAHLTRPVPGEENDPYRHAAAVHAAWVAGGQVAREERPALYPYVIEDPGGDRRLGLCTLIGVEPEGSPVIRPHESTLDKPFADRLGLLEATRIDLEPVMFLSDDSGQLEALLGEDVAGAAPLASHLDEGGNRHFVYKVTDPARIERYREVLGPCTAAIADGHHRYKVGRTYAERSGAAPGTGAACKMAVLFSLSSKQLTIDPIHRGLAEHHDLASLHGLLADRRLLAADSGEAVAAAVAEAARSGKPVLAVKQRGEDLELWVLDPDRMPPGQPPGAEHLAVAHLHAVLLPALGLQPANYHDGTVQYRAKAATLYRQVADGTLEIGFWLPPMTGEAFGLAISKGDLLPAKATRFLPKLVSGLVWAGHDARLG